MSKQDKILRLGFALFSAITSFLFVFYAVGVLTSDNASEWLKTFAYVSGGYGLMNIYILSWAWRVQAGWTVSANLLIAACFFGAEVMDFFRGNLPGGQQFARILGLAIVLGINWFAVKNLCQQEKSGTMKRPRKKR